MSEIENQSKSNVSEQEVRRAFIGYVKHATEVLTEGLNLNERRVNNPVKVAYIDTGARLRSLVEKAEHSSEFRHLYTAAFDRSISFFTIVQTFFRRSQFYLRTFKGKRQSPERVFDSFWSELTHRRTKATYLRILDDVAFASRTIDFGTFKIQKFRKKNLDILTCQEVNEVFYPFARVDTNILSQHWLLVEESFIDSESEKESVTDYDDWSWSQIRPRVPNLPVQLLAIHHWTPDLSDDECIENYATDLNDLRDIWPGFSVGEILVLNNNLCFQPEPAPDLSVRQPALDIPFNVPIGKRQELEIRAIVEKGQRLLRIVECVKPHWNFIEIAMGYIGKAFLAMPDLEQLLWNITVLDSLLSEKSDVTQTMKRRIGLILGTTDQERKEIRKQFDELYDFRSDLVHGNTFKKKAQHHHLANARYFARQVMGWFVDYLLWVDNDFRQREIGYEHYPRRDELLSVLDFDKPSLNRLNRFMGRLPAGFPKF